MSGPTELASASSPADGMGSQQKTAIADTQTMGQNDRGHIAARPSIDDVSDRAERDEQEDESEDRQPPAREHTVELSKVGKQAHHTSQRSGYQPGRCPCLSHSVIRARLVGHPQAAALMNVTSEDTTSAPRRGASTPRTDTDQRSVKATDRLRAWRPRLGTTSSGSQRSCYRRNGDWTA
jgi:hypothetical protein